MKGISNSSSYKGYHDICEWYLVMQADYRGTRAEFQKIINQTAE
jgi:hypothetical protein